MSPNDHRLQAIYPGLIGLLALVFGYLVIAKALHIPVTYDESGQILYYAKLSVYDIFMFTNPWPTNHILNSLLIKLFSGLFGDSLIVARLPNILAYCMSYYFVYKWSKVLFGQQVFGLLVSVSVLIMVNYSFDFYSLARGYGMALSFQLGALYYLYLYIRDQQLSSFWMIQLLLLGMFLSNFSWLSLWLTVEMIIGINMLLTKRYKRIAMLLGAVLVHVAFIYNPVKRMNETGQFVYWDSNGFFPDTFASVVRLYFYDNRFIHLTPDLIFALVIIFSLGILAYTYWKKGKTLLWLLPTLFFTVMFVTIIQNWILKTPFLHGRTALLFYPLIGLLCLAVLKMVWEVRWLRVAGSIGLSLFCILNFGLNYTKDSVLEWRFDRNTYQVLDALEQDNLAEISKRYGVFWLFQPSMNYHIIQRKLDWLQLENFRDRSPNDSLDYYYGIVDEVPILDSLSFQLIEDYGYEKLYRNPTPTVVE